ncbi:amino acid adenylation domain-containing protein [Streptosporangium sp. NPDC051023]|uniref:amino acid adenylation domain-containing protein n=1 Tax=Streptosporangium sp. NPDC051023 TaxID=3155410 RepID=UPI00344CCE60
MEQIQPLSYGQERLWFLHRFDPRDHSYNTCHAYRLHGELDVAALEAAFAAVARRHETLRTRFDEVDGQPVAIVCPAGPVVVDRFEAASEEEVGRIVAERANAPFDLSAAPPVRVALVRLGPGDHVLAVTLHHIIADGASVTVLREELAHHYAGRDPLPPLALQYGEHVRAERARHDGSDLGPWTARLADVPALDLPTDRQRPPQRTGDGAEFRFTLPAELVARVNAFARARRATPFMVLLSAYQVLLARHSGQADFCVGAPVAGRDRTELEPMIGFLSSMLALRADLSGDPSFDEVLKRTRRTVIQAMGDADMPLERLLGALGVERDASRTPLFQTIFALHTEVTDVGEGPLPGLRQSPFPAGWVAARTDLSLDLWLNETGGLSGVLVYSTDLFDRETAERLAARLEVLLADALDAPELPVAELDILPPAERRWLLGRDNPVEPPRETLVDMFLAQVAERPDAVAVVGEHTPDLTYAELAGRATALAVRLRDGGVGRGSLVAVRVTRGPGMLVALLGVTMAGAAYLPVDPAYPQARVDYVTADSGAALVLTDNDLKDLKDLSPAEPEAIGGLRDLSPAAPEIAGGLQEVTSAAPGAGLPRPRLDDTAYVLYTSGSTGRPKGVAVPHGALANTLLAIGSLVGARPEHAWLALTSMAFDISAVELYLPLITGGRVVVAEDARDGTAVAELVRRTGATHVQATPSGWRVLLAGDLPPVTGVTAGEPIPPQLARELRARTNRLINGYGPTETAIYSTVWDIPAEPYEIVIGRPVAGNTVHILDPAGGLAPVGVPGELFIGGLGVAYGYLGRPALTAERFVPDPYGELGARLYRTGDMGRWLPDGTIEFLGRTDNQIKLRGHRIELGEVEAVLESHPAVRQAVATVHEETLVAFVVAPGLPTDSGTPDVGGLREYMVRELPGYLVPQSFVPLDALPTTPNGKVDRKALPGLLAEARSTVPVDTTPPRTANERLVAGVFAEVLGRDTIGAHDDFFALGGHSLLATMVTARLPVRIPVREVFARPTVAALAELLDAGAPELADVPVPRPEGSTPPLSHGQERLWFLNRFDPDGNAAFNIHLVLRLTGPLDVEALGRAFTGVVARHETLRTRFPEVDGQPVVVIDPPGPVAVEYLTGDATALVAERVNTPFDLTGAPAVRVTLIRQDTDDHVLCVVAHHILGDGWSLNILRDELATLYSGGSLPPVPLQFGDLVVWQRGRDSRELFDYWSTQLADPTPLALPTDHPHAVGGTRHGAVVDFRLTAAEADALVAMGRRRGATLFMTLLAAYQVLLARHSGQNDILVGTSNAGRDTVELESVIGYITDVPVLRGDLSGDPTFTAFLAATRDTVLDAFAHQGLPFEQLVGSLRLERDLTRTPVFQTMAVLHTENSGRVPKPFPGLAAGQFAGGRAQAKFDLMLEAWHDTDDLYVELEYDTTLFERATAEAFASRLATLLRAITADPDRRLSALPMFTKADEAFLASVSRGPALPAAPPVPELVGRAIREHPDAPAISCAGRVVTYRELGELVEKAAARFRAGEITAVSLDRSPEGVAALLGAWRAGAAYLPLDPALPEERRAFMREEIDGVAAEGVAYVIYTSGSSGTPKGVLVEHEGLAARVAWMREAYGLGPGDRVVQFATLSFDTHAEEIYPALAAGACLELLPEGAVTLPDLLATPEGRRVTVLDLPTAYWHHLVGQLDEVAWPPALRLVILGGEELQAGAVARWRERFGDRVRLVNTYGPTEATVIATATQIAGTGRAGERPPIGRPIGAVHAAVLAEDGSLVPPGAPGELCLGGTGLARGYLRRPGLTAERFVPDPYGEPGARLYRTGDRARWRPDGQLEFLGRIDDQVKVRGFRVEPGEIEARLLTHPAVRQAAVVAVDDTLVGYVVVEAATGTVTEARSPADELPGFLAGKLPSYLVPSAWVTLDELPLTRNGKVDRKALPAPSVDRRTPSVPPRTDAEQLVAEVFCEVLGISEVGALDDFFAIGGHSLLATRVIARIRAVTDVEVPIRAMFEHGTVAGLAELVEDLLLAEISELSEEEAARLAAGAH